MKSFWAWQLQYMYVFCSTSLIEKEKKKIKTNIFKGGVRAVAQTPKNVFMQTLWGTIKNKQVTIELLNREIFAKE